MVPTKTLRTLQIIGNNEGTYVSCNIRLAILRGIQYCRSRSTCSVQTGRRGVCTNLHILLRNNWRRMLREWRTASMCCSATIYARPLSIPHSHPKPAGLITVILIHLKETREEISCCINLGTGILKKGLLDRDKESRSRTKQPDCTCPV